MMDIRIWIDRDLDLKIEKRMARGSTVKMLKDWLVKDDILQNASPQEIVLRLPGPGSRPLRDTERLNESLADLEVADASASRPASAGGAGKVLKIKSAPSSPSALVGRWLYNGKYQYHIVEGADGRAVYDETLSSGTRISGPLVLQAGGWFEVALTSVHDDRVMGKMKLAMTEPGVITSRFMNPSKEDWGPPMIAHLVVPVEWTPEVQEAEWFEVVYSKVLVKRLPNKDGPSWGFVYEGAKVQVRADRAVDARGCEWVELTLPELQRSVPDAETMASARGFVLIDGTRLGLGPLLRGPLPAEERPEALLKEVATRPPSLSASGPPTATFLPALPEGLEDLARGFVRQGWARVERLGMARDLLKKVRPEVDRLEWEMTPGQVKGDDFKFRSDRKVFFDTSSERRREDIPALNQLVDTLQGLAALLGRLLERSPMKLSLQGRCRPMLATYGPQGRYLPHVDNGDGDGRVLTMVYYLNPDWTEESGGHLRLYPEAERRSVSLGLSDDDWNVEVLPREDCLALFRADRMVHEVRPAEKRRVALTLWFLGECKGI